MDMTMGDGFFSNDKYPLGEVERRSRESYEKGYRDGLDKAKEVATPIEEKKEEWCMCKNFEGHKEYKMAAWDCHIHGQKSFGNHPTPLPKQKIGSEEGWICFPKKYGKEL